MKSRLLLDVVIAQCAAVFELLSGENESLLIWGDSFLILNLRLHVIDGVGRLDIKGNGLTSKSLNEDLHTSDRTTRKYDYRSFNQKKTEKIGNGVAS